MEEQPGGIVLCVTGAECTGKTTLAIALAEALGAPLVGEAARSYLAGRPSYGPEDVLAIAQAQHAAEQAALASAAPWVVADTDLTVIRVWWEERYGALHPWIVEALAQRSPRRYLLARPDLPWEYDPLRESPNDRRRLHARYRALLERDPFPYAEVSGHGGARVEGALRALDRWGIGRPRSPA